MEGKEDSSRVTKADDFPADLTPQIPTGFTGSDTPANFPAVSVTPKSTIPAGESELAMVTVTPASFPTDGKKKRGRPRKYGPDGKPLFPLSPMPISASIPLAGEFTGWKNGKGRPVDLFKKKKKKKFIEFNTSPSASGAQLGYSVGANFTPHVITVNTGEDVSMKIISFSQLGPRAICILAANGMISSVTLRQPNSSGGTLTYEGKFELLSLSGSFTPNENQIGMTKSRSGGMSVSLAGPDGRVLGGGLAGLLVAGSPVQVVIASFVSNHRVEQGEPKPKKPRVEYAQTTSPMVYPIVSPQVNDPVSALNINSLPKPNPIPANIMSPENNNLSFSGSDSKELSSSKYEVSC